MSPSTQVLVFDSGVGGLSIIKEIRELLPNISITYASDNAYFPYGEKDEAELIERVDSVLHHLVEMFKPQVIVVACNTASTVALPRVRDRFEQDIIGVVPAIKPAAQLSKSKCIALLATPGTIQRPYTKQLITDFADDCEVLTLGSSDLVNIAEAKLRGEAIHKDEIEGALSPLLEHESFHLVDTIVLACTHFPLLKQELAAVVGKDLLWVDSGEAIARRLKSILESSAIESTGQAKQPKYRSIFTVNNQQAQELIPALKNIFPSEIDFVLI